MGDVPEASGASWFQVAWFYVTGFFACWFHGSLDRFPALVAQAKFENNANFSGRGFSEYNNPWCVQVGSYFPNARPAVGSPDGGLTAGYSGYYKAWRDRLHYDDDRGITFNNGLKRYYQDVMDAGWLGAGASETRKSAYVTGCLAMYSGVPMFVRAFGNQEDAPDSNKWLTYTLVFIGLLAVVLFVWWVVSKIGSKLSRPKVRRK